MLLVVVLVVMLLFISYDKPVTSESSMNNSGVLNILILKSSML